MCSRSARSPASARWRWPRRADGGRVDHLGGRPRGAADRAPPLRRQPLPRPHRADRRRRAPDARACSTARSTSSGSTPGRPTIPPTTTRVLPKLAPRGVIVADNLFRGGDALDPDRPRPGNPRDPRVRPPNPGRRAHRRRPALGRRRRSAQSGGGLPTSSPWLASEGTRGRRPASRHRPQPVLHAPRRPPDLILR